MTDDWDTPRLYDDLAWLWPIWGGPEDYTDYCNHVTQLIREHAGIPVSSLLDIGCGGGKNVFNLKRNFQVTGLDLSPRMLELARQLNPECEFVRADMRSFDLGRAFDAVLLDDAITYMATRADLRAAFAAAWRHLHPGGVMVVNPDETRETFLQNQTVVTPAGSARPADVEVVFVENSFDPDTEDDQYEETMVYLIRERGQPRVEVDRHILGLFAIDAWRAALREVGFKICEQTYAERDKEYVTFVCLKPW